MFLDPGCSTFRHLKVGRRSAIVELCTQNRSGKQHTWFKDRFVIRQRSSFWSSVGYGDARFALNHSLRMLVASLGRFPRRLRLNAL